MHPHPADTKIGFGVFDLHAKRSILAGMPDRSFDFDALLGPIAAEDFFSTYQNR
jgi:hypothetical protein